MLAGSALWWPVFVPACHPKRPETRQRPQPVAIRHFPGEFAPAWGPSRREVTPAAAQGGGSSSPP